MIANLSYPTPPPPSAFQDQSTLFFVLDYCAGGELFFHLSRLKVRVNPKSRPE